MKRALPIFAALTALASGAFAQPAADAKVVAYPAAFFAQAQPSTALDMLRRLPGFTLEESDGDVRGFSGAIGNILIDGRRPASKEDRLVDILARIPARSVDRIELIRGAAAGIDMAGQAVLANIVRRREAALRGQAELETFTYSDRPVAPSLKFDGSRRTAETLAEASFHLYRTVDDEKGAGPRNRIRPDGSLLRGATYDEHDGFRGGEFNGAYERPAAGGRLRANLALKRERERAATDQITMFPTSASERDLEIETATTGEFGLTYDRPLGTRSSLELIALQRLSRDRASQVADDGGDIDAAGQRSRGGETIVRGLVRTTRSAALSLEAGAEAAYNFLDSHASLATNGQGVVLPNDDVRIEERRAEAFATLTWTLNAALTIEAGSRFEVSRLVQSGDSALAKSFFYPKPRVLISWSPSTRDQVRLSLERKVGQLDFGDFVSSASLTSGTVTAGNADLEPEKTWLFTATAERRFGKGAVVLTARHYSISDVVDRIPVVGPGTVFDAVGNLGHGTKDELSMSLNRPLDSLGVNGGLLTADITARRSAVTDPTTGARRRISKEEPFEGTVHFTQDIVARSMRWGADLTFGDTEPEFRFNEVRRQRTDPRLDLFAEYKPAPWTIRLSLQNLTTRSIRRVRDIYSGPRGVAPLTYTEDRDLKFGRYAGLLIRRSFG